MNLLGLTFANEARIERLTSADFRILNPSYIDRQDDEEAALSIGIRIDRFPQLKSAALQKLATLYDVDINNADVVEEKIRVLQGKPSRIKPEPVIPVAALPPAPPPELYETDLMVLNALYLPVLIKDKEAARKLGIRFNHFAGMSAHAHEKLTALGVDITNVRAVKSLLHKLQPETPFRKPNAKLVRTLTLEALRLKQPYPLQIADLSVAQTLTLYGTFLLNLSDKEIGQRLGLSTGSVTGSRSFGIQKLKAAGIPTDPEGIKAYLLSLALPAPERIAPADPNAASETQRGASEDKGESIHNQSHHPLSEEEQTRLIEENIHLVKKMARRLGPNYPSGVTFEDLVSAGYTGLMQTAKTFHRLENIPFSAAANVRIRSRMLDAFRPHLESATVRYLNKAIDKVLPAIYSQHGCDLASEDLIPLIQTALVERQTELKIEHLRIAPETIERALHPHKTPLLFFDMDSPENHTIFHSVPSDDESPEESAIRKEERMSLLSTIEDANLEAHIKECLMLRYVEGLKYTEIRDRLGYNSKSTVHRNLEKAYETIRIALANKNPAPAEARPAAQELTAIGQVEKSSPPAATLRHVKRRPVVVELKPPFIKTEPLKVPGEIVDYLTLTRLEHSLLSAFYVDKKSIDRILEELEFRSEDAFYSLKNMALVKLMRADINANDPKEIIKELDHWSQAKTQQPAPFDLAVIQI